jgi:NADH-quinone oxidoreductase subunit I
MGGVEQLMTDHQHADHQHAKTKPAKSRGAIPGLLKGLATTARTLTRPTHTAEYPDAQPHLPPRTHGVIALLEENCTNCMLCARECPDWCIYIDSHKETLPATTEGGRERQRNVLDRFAIDFSLCMYCGICIEVCPFDALHWSPEFEYAEVDVLDLLHEKSRLGQWMPTVPPPPALDANSVEAQEITAANKPARVPPTRTPPVKTPPVQTAPVQTPPVQTPPVQTPPVQTPPVQTPPEASP